MADNNGDPVLDGPFGHQLVHGNVEIDAFWRSELARSDPTADAYATTPSPGLSFLPSASSSGWLVSGLPIETTAAIDHPSAATKKFVRYGGFGFVELTTRLLEAICPSDLSGKPCAWDETWVWDPQALKWLGGCQMIRLCSRLQYDPQPAPPALSPYHYALHVGGEAHDALLALLDTPADVLALFKHPAAGHRPSMLTNLRDPHGVRGSGDRIDWPVVVPSPLPPLDPEHADSCTAIHGIEQSCHSLRDQAGTSKQRLPATAVSTSSSSSTTGSYHTAAADQDEAASTTTDPGSAATSDPPTPTAVTHGLQLCTYPVDSLSCPFGHDFAAVRTAAFDSHGQHSLDAEHLVRTGRAMRTQRLGDGGVDVCVFVRGNHEQTDDDGGERAAEEEGGEKGKITVDGSAAVRARWARQHVDGPRGACRVCDPGPAPVMGPVGIDARAEREEGWRGARMIMEESRARWLEMRGLSGLQQREERGRSAWEGEDVDEGLLSRWRETLGR